MENIFITQNINGKRVDIEQVKGKHIFSAMTIPEPEKKLACIFSKIITIDGEKKDIDWYLETEDIAIITFASDALNSMSNNTKFI